MAKTRSGLHKEVSFIFDGVPMPKDGGQAQETKIPDKPRTPTPTPPKPTPEKVKTPKWYKEDVQRKETPITPKHSPEPEVVKPRPEPTKTIVHESTVKQSTTPVVKKASAQPALGKIWISIKDRCFAPTPGVSHTRQIVMTVLIPVLFIVLAIVLLKAFGKSSPRVVKKPDINTTSTVNVSADRTDWKRPEIYPANLRDPMQIRSSSIGLSENGAIVIKGILYTEDKAAALVGTQVVYEGEKIFGATILKIEKNKVEFEMDGKKWIQKVQP